MHSVNRRTAAVSAPLTRITCSFCKPRVKSCKESGCKSYRIEYFDSQALFNEYLKRTGTAEFVVKELQDAWMEEGVFSEIQKKTLDEPTSVEPAVKKGGVIQLNEGIIDVEDIFCLNDKELEL